MIYVEPTIIEDEVKTRRKRYTMLTTTVLLRIRNDPAGDADIQLDDVEPLNTRWSGTDY